MALAIATGWDVADGSLTLFSSWFGFEPRYNPVPRGDLQSEVISRRTRLDGDRTVRVQIAGLDWADLDSYVTSIFTNWTGETSLKVTLRAVDVGHDESRWNAYTDLPRPGEDFIEVWRDQLQDLILTFRIVGPAS